MSLADDIAHIEAQKQAHPANKPPYLVQIQPGVWKHYWQIDSNIYGPVTSEAEARGMYEQMLELVDTLRDDYLASHED